MGLRKTVGGCPTASYFLLLRQKKVTKEKATLVCRPCGVPSLRSKRAGLRNSHDPLRGHVLKQCSPNPTARLLLNEAALKGMKVKGGFVCASRTFSLVLARRSLPTSRVLVLGF